MSRLLIVASAAALLLVAAPASAEDCTYTDLQGAFTITVDCAGLQDHSGNSQEQKRIWLSGDWGQLQILEVPDPYRTAELDHLMEKLGRFWTTQKTVMPITATTVAGIDARFQSERKRNTTSTTWVFQIGGRNVYARAVAFGKRGPREDRLETLSAAWLAGFKLVE